MQSFEPAVSPQVGVPAAGTVQSLATLRGFSGILTHSLDEPALLKQFLLFVRELFGLNRAIIFLADNTAGPAERRLRAGSSLGVSQKLLDVVALSFDSGLGQLVSQSARILRRQSAQVKAAPLAQREFEVLGAEVAVPILNREDVIGIALLDTRITGEPLTNPELELLFHLLEQLGMGLRNIGLHQQLSSNSKMLAGVLRELSSGCLVIDRSLKIQHANKVARKFFAPIAENRARDFEFDDLPSEIGSKIYQVLHTGTALVNHKFVRAGTVLKINIVPFQSQQDGAVLSVLLMAEDLTQSEQLGKLEVEAADLRLMRKMADRMSAEIGNAIVPISTYQQLFSERWRDAEFRGSMNEALSAAVRRIERLVNQMRYLAGQTNVSEESFSLDAVLEEGYQDACKYQTVKSSKLKYETRDEQVGMIGDRAALKYAFTEIMLNALLANQGEPVVAIRAARDSGSSPMVRIDIQDNGEGFTPESAKRATEPFFSTKSVGVGLGLTVARRIIEVHHGKLEIPAPGNGHDGLVRIYLPAVKDEKKRI